MNVSTKKITEELLLEVKQAIENVDWGSVEIYIQDNEVTQIAERRIKKRERTLRKK